MSTVHIVGAGVAGLAAAVRLAREGRSVALYEASGHAGGRCRSFHDSALNCTIDNGNHLLLSGNRSVQSFLHDIGAEESLTGPEEAAFPFVDLRSGARWTVRFSDGRFPGWLFRADCRPPGTRAADFLALLRLARAEPDATVGSLFKRTGALYSRFIEPLAIAALNTPLDRAAAAPLWQVLRETFGLGGAACRPLVARDGLSASFVDPALACLDRLGATVHFNQRLKAATLGGGRLERLVFAGGEIAVPEGDTVVLALPPAGLHAVLPVVPVPPESQAIVNIHFRLPDGAEPSGGEWIVGVLGGAAEWLFLRGPVVSVTISAANAWAERPAGDIASRVWDDVAAALGLSHAIPPFRVVKERRATFAQTPAAMRLRPGTQTDFANLFLAGDWTDTGLPATIESAVRSGHMAAEAILSTLSIQADSHPASLSHER